MVVLRDPAAIKALTHPARLAVLDELDARRAVTGSLLDQVRAESDVWLSRPEDQTWRDVSHVTSMIANLPLDEAQALLDELQALAERTRQACTEPRPRRSPDATGRPLLPRRRGAGGRPRPGTVSPGSSTMTGGARHWPARRTVRSLRPPSLSPA